MTTQQIMDAVRKRVREGHEFGDEAALLNEVNRLESELREAVDALEFFVRHTIDESHDNLSESMSVISKRKREALDLLVRVGRIVKDGESYRWSKP